MSGAVAAKACGRVRRLPYKNTGKSLHHYPTRLMVPRCGLMHCVGIEGGV